MVLDTLINFLLKRKIQQQTKKRGQSHKNLWLTKTISPWRWTARKKRCAQLYRWYQSLEGRALQFPCWFVPVWKQKSREERQGTTKGPDWDKMRNLQWNSQWSNLLLLRWEIKTGLLSAAAHLHGWWQVAAPPPWFLQWNQSPVSQLMRRPRAKLVSPLKAFQKVLREDQYKFSLLPYEQRLRADNFSREERKPGVCLDFFLTESLDIQKNPCGNVVDPSHCILLSPVSTTLFCPVNPL